MHDSYFDIGIAENNSLFILEKLLKKKIYNTTVSLFLNNISVNFMSESLKLIIDTIPVCLISI